MATNKQAAQPASEGKKGPAFVMRVKVQEATRTSKAIWTTIGVLFEADMGNGEKGYSFRINSFPPQWDGSGVCMKPLPPRDE